MDGASAFVRMAARIAVATTVAFAALLPAASGTPLSRDVPVGQPDRLTIVRGGCSAASHWRLAVRHESGSLRITLIVRSGVPGQRWNVFMDHNGRGFFAGARVSDDRGLVGVRRTTTDLPGVDRFRAGANNTVTGESCRGRVRT